MEREANKEISLNMTHEYFMEILDHAWTLFENQADCETDGLVKSALYFSSQHDFDIEVLPPKLYDRVAEKIKQESAAAYEDEKVL